ncbi:GntR family transcriptional regulator [Paenibacillus allorhizoplanae]|uniref:GntR family transcriptional regulator n=1 Tax=Paenibacillus allorhizoplanae TaxID=2905648 RepID=UPI001F1A53C4|nr:GntR family transcriptional regulator [Paenibacillus allorhizoplanae]
MAVVPLLSTLVALYERVVEQLLQEMKNGKRRAGDKLPSIREGAEAFSCSKNTVIQAYGELEQRQRSEVRFVEREFMR